MFLPEFDQKCNCTKQLYIQWNSTAEVFVVNCTNSNFQNTTMLEFLPHETVVLLFNGNNITHFDWNVFGVWDDHLPLELIDLTNNNIEDIDGKAFHKVPNGKFVYHSFVIFIFWLLILHYGNTIMTQNKT